MKNRRNIIILIVVALLLIVFICNITTPNMRLRKSLENINETKSIIVWQYTGEPKEKTIKYGDNLYKEIKVINDTETLNNMINIFNKIEINLEEVTVLTDVMVGNPFYVFDLLDENGNIITQIKYLNLSIEGLDDNIKLADEYKNELNEIIGHNEYVSLEIKDVLKETKFIKVYDYATNEFIKDINEKDTTKALEIIGEGNNYSKVYSLVDLKYTLELIDKNNDIIANISFDPYLIFSIKYGNSYFLIDYDRDKLLEIIAK